MEESARWSKWEAFKNEMVRVQSYHISVKVGSKDGKIREHNSERKLRI